MIPNFGMGTFRLKGLTLTELVTEAIEMGYKQVDTAQAYENEADVGKALAQTKSDDVFVTTKVWFDSFKHQQVLDSLKQSADKLQRDKIDLALIHWPSPNDEVAMEETLDALTEAREQGLIKHFGVSNFTTGLMERAIKHIGADNIMTNQIEVHPFMQNRKVTDACDNNGIKVTAYLPLAKGKVVENSTLQAIAAEHNVTAAQVALAWEMQKGFVTIPSTTKTEHLRSNLKAQKIQLTDQDMADIAALDQNDRLIDPDFAPKWD
ncbi:2,5-didehydrogluconate reductase DkgB [Idiomarina seosinensis]|uniref:2,5-didehydrogluconate reductase DkgB n=1 Tax=Idiomarina seosinensis TaxID=281739 RepID=A0A432ZHT4_9GAMM|nr:2,5-didehydrogluconate reductase DkgB [Idiomarina seosinensis]RUO77531.1 2,5-didehydrogluconate reductase DkgB [Idiomarina seosinensis]